MRHFFIDTNVLLDFLAQREPFTAVATQLFESVGYGRATLYASGLSFSHIDYVLRKALLPAERLAKLTQLSSLVEIISIGRPVIEATLLLGFADFEDGLQYCAARSVPAIVTRDPKGFAAGMLPVLTTPAALARLGG